jgi:putative ABC transport system substrate-binding protein
MKRRVFLVGTATTLATTGVTKSGLAQNFARVGYLTPTARSAGMPVSTAFRDTLAAEGYIEGQNVVIERRFAEGNVQRLSELAADLVRSKVDVIFTTTDLGAVAAKNATATIPIIFMSVSDPVALGLTATLARPGGNATGVTNVHRELTRKRLALLREVAPSEGAVGVLTAATPTPTTTAMLNELNGAAKFLRVRLEVQHVEEAQTFDDRIAAIVSRRLRLIYLVPHPLFYLHRARLSELCAKAHLAMMAWAREFAEAGALIAYGVSNTEMARRGALYVAKVLRGAKPGELPVEGPTKFEMVINSKTARTLGLTIAPSLLVRADEVIQ